MSTRGPLDPVGEVETGTGGGGVDAPPNRRRWLKGAGASLAALWLAACDRISAAAKGQAGLARAEGLTRRAQRLVVDRQALAREYGEADVSAETLACTTGLDNPGEVNLEKSLRLADRLGGHLVSGHVDGVGEVALFEERGESMLLRVKAPAELSRYIARKGSITIQGVSLTVNAVEGAEFEVNIIPHTLERTVIGRYRRGTRVNIEVDLVARYIESLLAARDLPETGAGVTRALLAQHGYIENA